MGKEDSKTKMRIIFRHLKDYYLKIKVIFYSLRVLSFKFYVLNYLITLKIIIHCHYPQSSCHCTDFTGKLSRIEIIIFKSFKFIKIN